MKYALAIGFRYGALAIQFLMVLLVTRTLPQAEAGQYFIAFGIVATIFALAGAGLPDGLVKTLGEDIARGRRKHIRSSLVIAGMITFTSSLVVAALAVAFFVAVGGPLNYIGLTAIWGFCYGMVFFAAQGLVALRFIGLGSYFFYTSTNVLLLVTSFPYLLLATDPNLIGLMTSTVCAAGLSMLAACVMLWSKLAVYPAGGSADLRPAFSTGSLIALSRMLQATLYWIPVWVAGVMLGAVDASIVATAGRLLIAVSAVIAAMRFSIRPEIVAASVQGDWPRIERTGRNISFVATLATLLAMLGTWYIGRPVIIFLFGSGYTSAWVVLMILLIGALAEAIGGPVDEILKMTGHTPAVLIGLVATVVIEIVLAFMLSKHGISSLAWAQALSFCGMYAFQIAYLYRQHRCIVLPYPYKRRSK